MTIRRLSPDLINRIAAGEVIERPSSALKELIENALDAQATEIQIHLRRAGQSFLSVRDNGCGIPHEELHLALERHATSKLPEKDLFHIRTFGFRGEALPAIAAVSRLTVISRPAHQTQGWSLTVEGGEGSDPRPILASAGTCVEVADLFFTTPARLKFLKSERSEWVAIRHLMEQFALAHPHVSFKVVEEKRVVLDYPMVSDEKMWEELIRQRLQTVLRDAFAQEALFLHEEEKGYKLRAFLGLPTAHSAQAFHQFFFVNGRPIKDKMLSTLIKVAYHDVVPHGRFPAVVFFLDVPLDAVDVNVHPAKTEVRFSEGAFLKEWMLDKIKQKLKQNLLPSTQRLGLQAVKAFSSPVLPLSLSSPKPTRLTQKSEVSPSLKLIPNEVKKDWLLPQPFQDCATSASSGFEVPSRNDGNRRHGEQSEAIHKINPPIPELAAFPLGHAVGQIHNRYIVAQNEKGFLIIDQHAAHERLVYEKMKKQAAEHCRESEALLIPLMVNVGVGDKVLLEDVLPSLKELGFDVGFLGEQTLIVRAVPSLLKDEEWEVLLQDIVDAVRQAHAEESVYEDPLARALNLILSAQACQRRSIKSGKKLSTIEMDQLLRDMEHTPHAAQCNHGRPTYIVLEMQQLDGLFKRHG